MNNDVRVRVWTLQIAEAGVYDIETGGTVDGYINPQLAFGRDTSPAWMPWVDGPPVDSYQPTDHGVRVEQLKTLAALRDSGALTEAEFESEKRRVLEG
ncbi:SHOCT domain-containing protein [Mycobacterium sp. 236(2023)]|uniref:SHOCT domain-containing protein n=1 Tax=Mycobacterium sp. 236(2023) TaxID=3038163 RepID=UPI003241DC15